MIPEKMHTVSGAGKVPERDGDCRTCGTCCFSELDTYVRVSGDDHARLGARADELTHFVGNRAFMRMERGRCAGLVVDPDRATFTCSVYEQRPDACRELSRGSPACAGEITTKGDRPPRALRVLRG